MTRYEHRKACIEMMDEALYARTGTRMSYTTIAFIFDSLHGLVYVGAPYPFLPCPICHGVEGCDHSYPERAAAGDLTNTPERKP